MQKIILDKDNPHADIGKQKFTVRKYFTAWVEYEVVADSKDEADSVVMEHGGIEKIDWAEGYHKDQPVEVSANDHNMDHSVDTVIQKIAECIPYEDSLTVDYSDPDWSTNEFEWNEDYENPNKTESKSEEVPF